MTWVVDLRGTDGGSVPPMLDGMAPLLRPGPLCALRSIDGKPMSQPSISRRGIGYGRAIAMRAGNGLGALAGNPVVVLVDAGCLSACEFVAVALSTRSRTLLVRQPTGGYTTGNVVHPIGDHDLLVLTEGVLAAPPGRIVDERVRPDVVIESIDERTPGSILEDPSVASWLRR